MNIGWIGLGKMGLPMALALAYRGGNRVYGYDPSQNPYDILVGVAEAPHETGIGDLLRSHRRTPADADGALVVHLGDDAHARIAADCGLVFVAVQTPHPPELDGTQTNGDQIPVLDFEYQFLIDACQTTLSQMSCSGDRQYTLAIMSTVLPGTCNRLIRPMLPPNVRLVYCPSFIALGTVIPDFCDPDLLLLGADHMDDTIPVVNALDRLREPMQNAELPHLCMTIESAEMAKMARNVMDTVRLHWANVITQTCDGTGADASDVLRAVYTRRRGGLANPTGGMVDGGPCRPRDLLAMAALAEKIQMGYNAYGQLFVQREEQSRWLASRVLYWHRLTGLSITLLGVGYKANSPLTFGSPGLLLLNQLRDAGLEPVVYDPIVEGRILANAPTNPQVYVVTTDHRLWHEMNLPAGSILIDPWGTAQRRPGVTNVTIGSKRG